MKINEFISNIRYYDTENFLTVGSNLLTKIYKSKSNLKLDNKIKIILMSYGYRILTLKLLVKELKVTAHIPPDIKEKEFIKLCEEYFEINQLETPDYEYIREKLLKSNFSDEYVNIKVLREVFSPDKMNVYRCWNTSGNYEDLTSYKIVSSYKILKFIRENNQTLYKEIEEKLGYSILEYFRIAFSLFAYYLGPENLGKTSEKLNIEKFDKKTRKLGIKNNKLNKMKSLLTKSEDSLIKWYEKFCEFSDSQKKCFPIPEIYKPIVYYNRYSFLFSPELGLDGILNYIFYDLRQKDEDGNEIGAAFEKFLLRFLKSVIGENRVEEIERGKKKTPDFMIDMGYCQFIVECKAGLISYTERCTLSNEALINIMDRSFSALKQLEYINENMLLGDNVVPIVVYCDNPGVSPYLFNIYAQKAGILPNKKIKHIEYISLFNFMDLLKKNSVESVFKAIYSKYQKIDELKVKDLFEINAISPKGSHNYEFLNEEYNELFKGLIKP